MDDHLPTTRLPPIALPPPTSARPKPRSLPPAGPLGAPGAGGAAGEVAADPSATRLPSSRPASFRAWAERIGQGSLHPESYRREIGVASAAVGVVVALAGVLTTLHGVPVDRTLPPAEMAALLLARTAGGLVTAAIGWGLVRLAERLLFPGDRR